MPTLLPTHFANQPNVTVASEVPLSPTLPVGEDARIPDLMSVRGGDRKLMEEQQGYAIDCQGKAPDFVLEVASPIVWRADYTDRRADYERFGIGEYWRFDPSDGEYHDAALAGDRLVGGIRIKTLGEGRIRGHCEAMGWYGYWEGGRQRFFDPVTESYLLTHEEDAALARAAEERAGRMESQSLIDELEDELRRMRGE